MNSTSLRFECGDLGPALQQTPEGQKQKTQVSQVFKKRKKKKHWRSVSENRLGSRLLCRHDTETEYLIRFLNTSMDDLFFGIC